VRALLSISFLLCSLLLNAQGTNEMDNIYTPPNTSIAGSERTSSKGDISDGPKNIIKFSPLLLTRSIFALEYERFINNNFSARVGLGSSYNRDYVYLLSTDAFYDLQSPVKSSLNLQDIVVEGTFIPNSSPYLSAGLRLYYDGFSQDEFNSYFDINSRFYTNTYDVLTSAYYNDSTAKVDLQNTVLNMSWGFSSCTSGKVQTSHDFYIGFGMRIASFLAFKETTIDVNGSTETINIATSDKIVVYSPTILFGYTLGIGW
jgi:hypothetical protein